VCVCVCACVRCRSICIPAWRVCVGGGGGGTPLLAFAPARTSSFMKGSCSRHQRCEVTISEP
jgi:hypothetical protein